MATAGCRTKGRSFREDLSSHLESNRPSTCTERENEKGKEVNSWTNKIAKNEWHAYTPVPRLYGTTGLNKGFEKAGWKWRRNMGQPVRSKGATAGVFIKIEMYICIYFFVCIKHKRIFWLYAKLATSVVWAFWDGMGFFAGCFWPTGRNLMWLWQIHLLPWSLLQNLYCTDEATKAETVLSAVLGTCLCIYRYV